MLKELPPNLTRTLTSIALVGSISLGSSCDSPLANKLNPEAIPSCHDQPVKQEEGPKLPKALPDLAPEDIKGLRTISDQEKEIIRQASVRIVDEGYGGGDEMQSGVMVEDEHGKKRVLTAAHGLIKNNRKTLRIIGPDGKNVGVKQACYHLQARGKLLPLGSTEGSISDLDADIAALLPDGDLGGTAVKLSKTANLTPRRLITFAGTPGKAGDRTSKPELKIFRSYTLGKPVKQKTGNIELTLTHLDGTDGLAEEGLMKGMSGGGGFSTSIGRDKQPILEVSCIIDGYTRGEKAASNLNDYYGRPADAIHTVEVGVCTDAKTGWLALGSLAELASRS